MHAGIDSWVAHCRSQLSEAEQQSSVLLEQQEGAEDLVRALRHELHSLRQDTNSVAANARQTVSEKEALQVWSVSHTGAAVGPGTLKGISGNAFTGSNLNVGSENVCCRIQKESPSQKQSRLSLMKCEWHCC